MAHTSQSRNGGWTRTDGSGVGDGSLAAEEAVNGTGSVGRAADALGLFELPLQDADEKAQHAVQSRDAIFRRLLALADVLATATALLVVAYLAGYHPQPAALVTLPSVLLLGKLLGLYDRDELLIYKSTLEEAPKLLQLSVLFAIFVWFMESLIVDGGLGKLDYLLLWAIAFTGCVTGRAAARWLAHRIAPSERAVFFGPPATYRLVRSKLELGGGAAGVELVARHDLEDERGASLVCGRLGEIVQEHCAHRVILAPIATDSDAVLDLIREAKANGVKISLMPRFSEVLGSSVTFDTLHGITLLSVRQFGLNRSSKILKRSFDVAVAGLGLLATAPLFAAIALAIWLASGSPVLYRQTRVGRRGERFEMLKFRTMVPEAEQLQAELEHLNEADGLFKIADDPRVTRVGRFLRRTYLDELPQLLNVLRGEMSVVGPRPLVLEDDGRVTGWYRQRLDIAPGMTGHWQTLGSSRVPLHEMVAIDYLYVVNWSLWADVKYLLRTTPHVLGARGL
jgi:exopolysaccharide biosynthesis polyprenyl glycosylphosphotransferase